MSAEQAAPAVRRPEQVPASPLRPGVTAAEMLDDRHGCRGLHQRRLRFAGGTGTAAGAETAGTAGSAGTGGETAGGAGTGGTAGGAETAGTAGGAGTGGTAGGAGTAGTAGGAGTAGTAGGEIAGTAGGQGEAWYVITGSGVLDTERTGRVALEPGTAVWLEPGLGYACQAQPTEDLEILAVTVRAGPVAPSRRLEAPGGHAGVLAIVLALASAIGYGGRLRFPDRSGRRGLNGAG